MESSCQLNPGPRSPGSPCISEVSDMKNSKRHLQGFLIVQESHLILGTLRQNARLGPLSQEHHIAALPPQNDRHALSDLCKVHQSNPKAVQRALKTIRSL